MKQFVFLFLASLAFGQITADAQAPGTQSAAPATPAKSDDDPVVLTIGATKITKSQFEKLVQQAQQPGQAKATLSPEGRRKYAENIAELIVLAQEARRQKMDQDADMKFQIALRADQILAYTMFQKLNANVKVDDQASHAYYDAHKAEWETVSAKHILIRFKDSPVPLRTGQVDRTDEEALAKIKEIRSKIVSGESFVELAKTESDDTGSGVNGGELGDFTRGKMVPEFEQAAFAAKVGEVTEPVKTRFGYHIILVSKHESKSFDEVASQIDEQLKPELAQKAIDDLKKDVPVTFDKDYFGR